ncbi:MAG TPA: hypothetical protein VLL27_04860 [Solirubrobacterales bacterium]|nr:hypothetical protein [Solirubrobacterales bacterium]
MKKHAAAWGISTMHFDPIRSRQGNFAEKRPLSDIMVAGSSYSRYHLKCRLYAEGLKQPRCELCGQGDIWRGSPMSMILDHINGTRDDHRLENLRIVCPNCAATLDTHCGRKNRIQRPIRACKRCGKEFVERSRHQRYCSRACGVRWDRSRLRGRPNPGIRKAERPPYRKLLAEIETTSYCAVGRKYGVSDNAVRKWVRFYERQAAREVADAVREAT